MRRPKQVAQDADEAEAESEETSGKTAEELLLDEAMTRFDLASDADAANREAAESDLRFFAGEHWSETEKEERKGRPCWVEERAPQFVRQVTGDVRLNKPAIKVSPADDGDEAEAEAREILIQHVEYRSDAQNIYADWHDHQAICGIGHVGVNVVAQGDKRELEIALIPDPLAVYWDPSAVKRDRSDARYCFVVEEMPREEFEAAYPDVADDWGRDDATAGDDDWVTRDEVRVAVYWRCDYVAMLEGVRQPTLEEALDGQMEPVAFSVPESEGLPEGVLGETKLVERKVVRSWLLTSRAILEGGPEGEESPFNRIPVIPAIGEEIRLGRRVVRRGLVRPIKDLNRGLDWTRSLMIEAMSVAPRAKWLTTDEHVEGREKEWDEAYRSTVPRLTYKPDNRPGAAPPQWVQPSPFPPGLVEAARMFDDGMKAVTGIYDASLGARSNETSGKAILARERQGDTSTYIFTDNFLAGLRSLGQLLVDAFPKVYTDEMVLRIFGADAPVDPATGQPKRSIVINGSDPITGAPINPMEVGEFDVRIEAGPAFASRRDESVAGMTAMVQAFPALAPVALPYIAKNQNWPEHQKLAEGIKQMMQPQPSPKDEADVEKTRAEAGKITEDTRRTKLETDAFEVGFVGALRTGTQLGPAPSDQGGSAGAPNGAARSGTTGA